MKKLAGLVINEDAYLSKEEDILVIKVQASQRVKNMSLEEREEFWEKLPTLRMFADCEFMFDGAEEYYKSEEKNIKLIKERAWEVYEELI